ncbi:DUF998 domain-containing protein [Amycolatopsis sp. PS_44_ISF1]|uniref:DUF998 domain-containing protein n=1 Tax=Amycolatopsis sp. PS_44_ISF1 TaxID=2974917 RepID=UPI0028DF4E3F|nr:DUF998 domain-containing protein [Amycolatopsis sp. PS_44_ISF1]MDT8909968.1 DUF998 domain-containing protein [Amycolatopsis sp. PS_44_ISF1]
MGNSRGLRIWRLTALAAITWGMFTITALHVISSRDPVYDTLSSYTITDRGQGLLGASVLSLAVGSLAVLGALLAAGVPLPRTTRVLLTAWSLGLATAAVFPASYPQNPNPLSGDIHLYSCLVAFTSLPGAALTLLDPLRDSPHRQAVVRWLRLGLGVLALFGLSFLFVRLDEAGVAPFHRLADALPIGVTQRLMLVADVLLLLGLVRIAVWTHAARAVASEESAVVIEPTR